MTSPRDGRIPLTIVTGFLGSGKTTLIRSLLANPRFANAAIIVNEFGAIGIDHHLFRKTDERITLLGGGCACCARRDDLVEALLDLLRRLDREEVSFDHVLLETSGLADPAPIRHTIVADPVLSRRYRIARTIATLDAVAGASNLETYGEATRQITSADAVVITKRDLADESAVSALTRRMSGFNPVAEIILAEHGHVDIDRLWQAGIDLPSRHGHADLIDAASPDHDATKAIHSLALTFDEPPDWRMVGLWLTMLLHAHGESVLRVKGLLDVGEEGPLLLEGVQHVVHQPRHLDRWPDASRQGRLVFIMRDIDPTRIADSFAAFQAVAQSS